MIRTLVFFISGIVCFTNASKAQGTDNIKAIEVQILGFPMGDDFYRVYYSGDFIIYKGTYHHTSSFIEFDSTGRQRKQTELVNEKRTRYFIFHKDSAYGYSYTPSDSLWTNRRGKVDSVLKLWIMGQGKLDTLLNLKPDSVIWNQNKTDLKEVYVFPATADCPSFRWIVCYNSTMNDIPETFSVKMDNSKKMKLYKVETASEKFYQSPDKSTWYPLHIINEMHRIDVDHPEEIKSYVDLYKKSIGLKL